MALDVPEDVHGGPAAASDGTASDGTGLNRSRPDRAGSVADRPPGVPRATLSRVLALPLVIAVVGLLPGYVTAQPGTGVRDSSYWLQLALTLYAGGRLCAMVLSPAQAAGAGRVLAVLLRGDGRGPARAGRDRAGADPGGRPAYRHGDGDHAGARRLRRLRRGRVGRPPPAAVAAPRTPAGAGGPTAAMAAGRAGVRGQPAVHHQTGRPRGVLHQPAGHQRVGAGQRADRQRRRQPRRLGASYAASARCPALLAMLFLLRWTGHLAGAPAATWPPILRAGSAWSSST